MPPCHYRHRTSCSSENAQTRSHLEHRRLVGSARRGERGRLLQNRSCENGGKGRAGGNFKGKEKETSRRLGRAVVCGGHIISVLSHDEHSEALTVCRPQMLVVLAFKRLLSLPHALKTENCDRHSQRNLAATLCRHATALPCPL